MVRTYFSLFNARTRIEALLVIGMHISGLTTLITMVGALLALWNAEEKTRINPLYPMIGHSYDTMLMTACALSAAVTLCFLIAYFWQYISKQES